MDGPLQKLGTLKILGWVFEIRQVDEQSQQDFNVQIEEELLYIFIFFLFTFYSYF